MPPNKSKGSQTFKLKPTIQSQNFIEISVGWFQRLTCMNTVTHDIIIEIMNVSNKNTLKLLGYGSGWDVIVPSGYGLPFWQTFIMFGARSGGLREMKNLAFEMGECYLSPDSNAGKLEEKRIEVQLREKYFRLPPSKRVNYQKLGIVSPFICPWKVLLSDWSGKNIDSLFILRDKSIIDVLQQCFSSKYKIPHVDKKEFCLVAVHLQIIGKGNFKPHALICMPQACDYQSIKTLLEPHHEDRNEKTRKEKRLKHLQFLKQIKKKRRKVKQKGFMDKHPKQVNTSKTSNTEPSEYVKSMRELWVPSNIKTVQSTCSRPILGYLTQGSFSFTQAQSCGIGYIAFNSLEALLQNRQDKVLVRNTTSRKYRLAKLQLIKCV